MTTQLLILENILWLPLCRINKFGLNTLPLKIVAIPYTCGLSATNAIKGLSIPSWSLAKVRSDKDSKINIFGIFVVEIGK